jgi:peptidoglycan/LPS O-acetylase OafA/YrhL
MSGTGADEIPSAISAPETARVRSREIPSLDGMRALAVTFVFVAHAGLEKWVPGGFGVTLFFFLSGFLITTLLRIEFDKKGRVSIPNFYMRRFLRIFPPLYITVTLSVLLGLFSVLPTGMTPLGIASHYLFFTNYHTLLAPSGTGAPGMGPLWSLAVEEHFYLMFPVIFSVLLVKLSPQRKAAALFAFCAVVLFHRTVVALSTGNFGWTYLATDTRLDSIAFGCILALWRNPFLDDEVRESPPKIGWFWLGIAGLLLCFAIRADIFRETIRYTIQGLSLMPVFTAAILWPEKTLFRWLNWPVMKWTAAFSYTIYLIHYVGFDFVEHYITKEPVLRALIAGVLIVGYAWLLYAFVEKPIAKLRKRYT